MKNKFLTALLSIFLLFHTGPSAHADSDIFVPTSPIMPVNKIKAGMKGVAYTVISGTKITPFKVSILGVLPRKTNPKNLILFKIEDKEINESGGIASGMSGSPIYVDDKLIGAIGYAWSFSERSLGLATPIEEMVSALDWPERLPKTGISEIIPVTPLSADIEENSGYEKEATSPVNDIDAPTDIISTETKINDYGPEYGDLLSPSELFSLSPKERIDIFSTKQLIPLGIPILADGMSPRAVKLLEKKLGQTIIPLGSSTDSAKTVNYNPKLKPGAAIGAALAWGDIQVNGIGTLTALDGEGRFIAFAHPMLNAGAVAYALTEASIVKIIPSINSTFKLGSTGSIIGTITQDRPVAIAGKIGHFAAASSYSLNFRDLDTDKREVKRFQTLADSFTGPALGYSGMSGLIENAWGRSGEGTAVVKYKISGGNLDKGWERENIFFSDENLIDFIMSEFEVLTRIFSLNQFQEIRPFGIDFDVEVTREPKVMFIEKIDIVEPKDAYEPGERIEIELTTRIWRQQPKKERITVVIPEDAAMLCEIAVRSGRESIVNNDSAVNGLSTITNLEDLMKELSVVEKNNQIIVELIAPMTGNSKNNANTEVLPEDLTDKRLKNEIQKEKIESESMLILNKDYYIEGKLSKFIKIKEVEIKETEVKKETESVEEIESEEESEKDSTPKTDKT